MLFYSPLWLVGLVPWAAVVLWLLWGRRRKTPVAFLDLWRGPALQKPAKRALQPPPFWMAMALLALLLALLGSARPVVRLRRVAAAPITIIVDRGITMSALNGGEARFVAESRLASKQLSAALPRLTPVHLIVLPDERIQQTTLASWADYVSHLPPTALDTGAQLRQTIRDRLALSDEPLLVISDQPLETSSARVIQLAPGSSIENVGIVLLSARRTPRPQVMVRLRNDSSRARTTLSVKSGAERVTREIALPPTGQTRDYFFDLESADKVIVATIEDADDQPADNEAWLVREGSFPRIEPGGPLPPELARMVETFSRARPPANGAPTVKIVSTLLDLPTDEPAVVVSSKAGALVSGTPQATPDAITANVDWSAFPRQVRLTGDPPAGWTPVLSIGNRVIVAQRASPARQAWVGFAPGTWAQSTDFVVFWANVFTWAGGGADRFAVHPLSAFEPGWKLTQEPARSVAQARRLTQVPGQWPGLYESADGTLRAFNAAMPPAHAPVKTPADWPARLKSLEGNRGGGWELAPALLALAVCFVAVAAGTFHSGLTPQVPARTFSSL